MHISVNETCQCIWISTQKNSIFFKLFILRRIVFDWNELRFTLMNVFLSILIFFLQKKEDLFHTQWLPLYVGTSACCMSAYFDSKLWSETNRTMLGLWHFVTVSGHCFAHYINSLYKTGNLIVILRCPTYLNLNYIKNYDIKDILFCLRFFSIL